MIRFLSSALSACIVTLSLATPGFAALPVPKPPQLDAKSYILVDYLSGRVLAEHRADERVEPASITKVMTTYIAFDAIKQGRASLDTDVHISEKAWRQGIDSSESRMFLDVGKTAKMGDLLRGIVIQSGNDAAVALAEHLGGSEEGFAQMMNHYAKTLGLKHTHYHDASGLPAPDHYTTARDIATLSRALIRNFPDHYKMFAEREFTYHGIRQHNRNGLLGRDPSVDGIKTGHTNSAGYCLAASAKRGDMRLISVVMGTPSIKARESANAALLNYGFTFYETARVKGAREVMLKPRVFKSESETAPVGPATNVFVTVSRGEGAKLATQTKLDEPLIAPLRAGQRVGEMTVANSAGQIVARVPLVLLQAVPEGGWWTTMTDSIALWFD